MKNKYGTFTDNQFDGYKKRLHSLVHWLLIYAEENYSILDNYFEKVQYKMIGLNELLEDNPTIVEIMVLIESARKESQTEKFKQIKTKEEFKNSSYRKAILDIHQLIDKL
jgi:uncharacterized iron-regulated protein